MKPARSFILAAVAALLILPAFEDQASAQTPSLTEKINAYVGCINRLSERSYDSRRRYFEWVGKNGPTGKERIIYGTYTIYDTSGCRKYYIVKAFPLWFGIDFGIPGQRVRHAKSRA